MISKLSSWGGKRKGAGRPSGEKTKVIRVPHDLFPKIKNFIQNRGMTLPFYSSRVQAGFPSPADDHMEGKLDLNQHLISNPASTFFVKVAGDSMKDAGIFENDLLVVDRSKDPASGRIVIAAINGELTVKRLLKNRGKTFLVPENKNYKPLEITEHTDHHIWGVVTHVIHSTI